MFRNARFAASLSLAFLLLGLAGCNLNGNRDAEDQQQREEKAREEARDAAERAKPEIQAAGRALGQAAQTAAEDARAAAQGLAEGWKEGTSKPLDLNAATEGQLETLPGITTRDARRIIEHRPYRSKDDLVAKGVLSESSYAKIRDDVTTK